MADALQTPQSSDDSLLPLSVSDELYQARIQKKLELSTISDELRISQRFLKAIEVQDFQVLPEKVYTLGFIRSYGKYLGLDGDALQKRFSQEMEAKDSESPLHFPELQPEEGRPSRKVLIFSFIALLLIIMAKILLWP